jgi:hypothetical protein
MGKSYDVILWFPVTCNTWIRGRNLDNPWFDPITDVH